MIVNLYIPEKKLLSDFEATSVYLPGSSGDMQLLDNHIPIITSLKKGYVRISNKTGQEFKIEVDSGYASLNKNIINIVVVDISLSQAEIHQIQKEAEQMKSKAYKKEEITEKELSHLEE